MKKEDLFEALEDIDEKSVKEAREYKGKKKIRRWTRWGALAACIVICLIAAVAVPRYDSAVNESGAPNPDAFIPENTMDEQYEEESGDIMAPADVKSDEAETPAEKKSPKMSEKMKKLMVAEAVYPEPAAEGMSAEEYIGSEEHMDWWSDQREKVGKSSEYALEMRTYYRSMIEKMLVADDENTVCSPLNTYIAFSVLAEVSDGNTRNQILDMLQVPDIESLRTRVSQLWESNYLDTPTIKSLLANSIWLRDSVKYNSDTLDRVAKEYYASVFSGDTASPEMSEALREWTDENTGGLLGEYTKDMKLDADTVLGIVSTIYYKAAWVDEFSSSNNTKETFHGTKGDTTVEMMHKSETMDVCSTKNFTEIELPLQDGGYMCFYLPQEGVDVNDLAADPQILMTEDSDNVNWSSPIVRLSVPKFNVSGKTDLMEIIKDLGITDALDPSTADFSALTDSADKMFLSKAEHAAMVEIDEEGVTGAAYTALDVAEAAAPPDEILELVFDRPFLFMISGQDGSVLFSGIVRNIE